MKAAWVNQGDSYDRAKEGGFLWAPLQSSAGTTLPDHAAVGQLEPGDLVINYASGYIRAVGRVTHPPEQQPLPGGGVWAGVERASAGPRSVPGKASPRL
jgi:5-methylcytosine-specific restriction protein B